MLRKTIKRSPKQEAVHQAGMITGQIKGSLKRSQMEYLKIGALLFQMRDKKLFTALHHPDIEDYAEKRLRMKKSSLYRYLAVYEWVAEFHKEWLQPSPRSFIPELDDVADLMWIERKLQEKNLEKKARAELEAMRIEALEGRLRESELDEWQKRGGREGNPLKTFLKKLRLMRKRGAELRDMPQVAITRLDELIEIIRKAAFGG